MTFPRRALQSLLVVLSLQLLAGCEDPPPRPSSDAGVPDAGPYVWDGTYTELEEHGDWIDKGPFAPCGFDAQDASTTACEELPRFDVSRCDPAALAALPQEGIYQANTRDAKPLADGGTLISIGSVGFQLRSDGGPNTMYDEPLLQRDTQGGRFSVVGKNTRTSLTIAMVGCQTPAPDIITGCFASCRRGKLTQQGTFEAHRVARWAGEPESSGGLTLLSERHVALGQPVDVFVTKGHAYVVSLPHAGRDGGLTVFDVSDPSNPLFKTSISLPEDNFWNGVWAHRDALYVASSIMGTLVYDISTPAEPTFVRNLPTGTFGAHTVLVDGERLYAMVPNTGTFVYDVSQPLNPVQRARITVPGDPDSGGPHDTFAYGNRLYVSNAFGPYTVLDVTDLDDVRPLGQYPRPDLAYSHHSAVGTFAGRTLAFEGGEFNSSHLRVLDVTDPARIVKLGEFRMRSITSIHNLILRGTRLYVAWYHEGLRVLDVSNPTKPTQVAHYNTFRESDPYRGDSLFEGVYGVRVPGDGHVYSVDSSRGLLIFNEL
ncbi:hypothetical protein D7Y13_04480 [Corallococcus praedator]|uniref:Choice-of-anchor B family protein n=1 Tax=Corallococcus praedator TaxID=2316724 RepID=A0ABX9QP38_9BACT|nr:MULTISPECIES: hypothetical protein [Corallococcus]RKH36012.1 hypothetical protein D7X75_02080 [Corallococcus sp. CA031C]RKI15230.1 hypothetical protein D7Y13_04480 [Corallococcus praedator]